MEDIPTEIGSTQSFSYFASFSGEPRYYANKTYFLRSVFCSPDSTSYFGYTLNNSGDWVSNPEDKSELYTITTSPEGTWSGQLQAVVDNNGNVDNFVSGEYFFKLGRYTSSTDTSADWTSPTSLWITFPSPTSTPTPSSTSESTSTDTPTPTIELETTTSPSLTPTPSSTPSISYLRSIFLGSSSASPASGSVLATSSSKTSSFFPPLLVFGGGLFLFSVSLYISQSKFPFKKG